MQSYRFTYRVVGITHMVLPRHVGKADGQIVPDIQTMSWSDILPDKHTRCGIIEW